MLTAALAMLAARPDWLVDPAPYRATLTRSPGRIVLDNGLLRREIVIKPDAASVSLRNLTTGEELIRAVKPEATLQIDGHDIAVGGLVGQPDLAFLRPEWLTTMTADPGAIPFVAAEPAAVTAPFAYRPSGHFARRQWPPAGVGVALRFRGHGLSVRVHYELYDGIPLLAKWIDVENEGDAPITVDGYRSEYLGLVEGESSVGAQAAWRKPNLAVFTNYAFGGDNETDSQPAIRWQPDPNYRTIVNYDRTQPVDLVSSPPIGPGITLAPGQAFTSHRTYELAQDDNDRERSGLALRAAYRKLAPWAQENPLMLHLTSTDPPVVKRALAQAAACGFELVIFSFGSGLNMEDVSAQNLARFKAFADEAHSKGLMIGGYSLLASRRVDDADDVINPKTGKPGGAIFGDSPCLGSEWGLRYFEHIKTFLSATGFDMLEHDGSYPGDICASTTHPGHKGLADSQWTQFREITDFYHWCRSRGVFLNVPDWYFLQGSNKSGMGYRETNWSLPRDLQVIHARQNMFDGTWSKTPSMGWMFVPLVQYQGGGEAATIEPLKDHLKVYEQHLMNCLGFGVQACYRGPRLYDSPETEAVVKRSVAWFKAHRAIIEADVIHLRRADGRDWDGVLHVSPGLQAPALAMLYNPLDSAIKRTIRIPLHYAGLNGEVRVRRNHGKPEVVTLDANEAAQVTVVIPPGGWTSLEFTR